MSHAMRQDSTLLRRQGTPMICPGNRSWRPQVVFSLTFVVMCDHRIDWACWSERHTSPSHSKLPQVPLRDHDGARHDHHGRHQRHLEEIPPNVSLTRAPGPLQAPDENPLVDRPITFTCVPIPFCVPIPISRYSVFRKKKHQTP